MISWNKNAVEFSCFNQNHAENLRIASAWVFSFEVAAVCYLLRYLCLLGCVVSPERLFVASLDTLFWFVDEAVRLKPCSVFCFHVVDT